MIGVNEPKAFCRTESVNEPQDFCKSGYCKMITAAVGRRKEGDIYELENSEC